MTNDTINMTIDITIHSAELVPILRHFAGTITNAPAAPTAPEAPATPTAPVAPVAPVPEAPEAPVAPVPDAQTGSPLPAMPITAAPTYTMDQLARAGAALAQAGKTDLCIALLARYNVKSISQLSPEQYGAFAAELRALGAQL